MASFKRSGKDALKLRWRSEMRKMAIFLSLLGLGLTLLPSFFVLYGLLGWKVHTQLMFAGMLLWFALAPVWMKKRSI